MGTITLEVQGKEDKMHALQVLLEPYGARLQWALCLGRYAHAAVGPARGLFVEGSQSDQVSSASCGFLLEERAYGRACSGVPYAQRMLVPPRGCQASFQTLPLAYVSI